MLRSPRDGATTLGSVAVLVVVIASLASDVETAFALGGVCVLGVGVHRAIDASRRASAVRSRLSPRVQRVLCAALLLAAVVAVTDEASDAAFVGLFAAFGYVGYRTGSVLGGARRGAVAGALGSVALIALVGVTFVAATVAGLEGPRTLVLKTLIAPHVVGFVSVVWGVFVVLSGGFVGLAGGSIGGAVSRLL